MAAVCSIERFRDDAERIREATIEIKSDGSIELSPPVAPFPQTFEGVAAALEIAHGLTKLEIVWQVDPNSVDFGLMLQWMRIASKLNALPSLASLKVDIYWPSSTDTPASWCTYPFVDLFFDSLPDRLTVLSTTDFRTATLLRKRKVQLKSVLFPKFNIKTTGNSYFADLFRLKSAHIGMVFDHEETGILHRLHDCGPLDRNDRLQELSVCGTSVALGGIPQALRHLRAVNAHFKIEWGGLFWLEFQGSSDLEQMDGMKAGALEGATAMGDAGFGSPDDVSQLSVFDSEHWTHVSGDQLIEHFGWERKKLSADESEWIARASSFVHDNGVRVVMKLYK